MMSLETGSESASETVTEAVSSAPSPVESKNSGSGYSVTDPGFSGFDDGPEEDSADVLAALKAENTKKTPPETSGDASGEEQTIEETVETPADVESADSQEISDELLDKAIELGFTEEDLRGFSDVKALQQEVTRAETLRQRWLQRQAGKAPSEQRLPEPVITADEPEPEPDWEALATAGYGEEIINLQKANWHRTQRAEALAQQLLRAERQRAFDAQCERFDATLNSLGDEYRTILGTGNRGDLAKTSPVQAENRQAVFDKVNMLRHGYLTAGKKVPSEPDLIEEAVNASFFKQTQQIARQRLTKDIKNAGTQALSRPKSGGERQITGAERAMQKEHAFWRNRDV